MLGLRRVFVNDVIAIKCVGKSIDLKIIECAGKELCFPETYANIYNNCNVATQTWRYCNVFYGSRYIPIHWQIIQPTRITHCWQK